jgi:hypothetical protein
VLPLGECPMFQNIDDGGPINMVPSKKTKNKSKKKKK